MISRIDAHRRAWVEAYQQNARLNDPWAALERERAEDMRRDGRKPLPRLVGWLIASALSACFWAAMVMA